MGSDEPARSSRESAPWPVRQFEEFMPSFKSQYGAYEDAFVKTVKDKLLVVSEYPVEACGIVAITGLVLMRRPRRFLIRNTLGRFKSEQDLLSEAELSMKELEKSVENLKRNNNNILTKTRFGEEDILRGSSNMRSSGHQIQRLVNSIRKSESSAADLMHRLRSMPGRESIELRAEVASMVSDLTNQRRELEQRIFKMSELGIRV